MAGDVKIPVSADVKGVSASTRQVEKDFENVGKSVQKLGRIKWSPIDMKQIERDLQRLEKLVLDSQKRIAQAAQHTVNQGAPGASTPPGMPPIPAGTGGRHPQRRGPGAYTHAPQFWNIPQHLIGGVGGGFGQIGSYATRGAISGAYTGGVGGGAMGLLRGLGIGALAYGAFKIGQGVNEGYEMAKTRAGTLDSLKRQIGDVGVSFERLKYMSEAVADGMQMNSQEAAELAKEFSRLSRGAGGVGGVQDGTRTAVGVSRAYGLDPATGVGFFAGMANLNPRQNNKELALLIAEAVEKSGGRAKADDVMQAVQAFAVFTSRMSLTNPNLAAYGGAYAQMTASGIPGLTSEAAEGLLSQANMSVMRMGSAGEAGRNFMMAAFNRNGVLNPLQAQMLAEGGLFATRSSVFDPSGAIGRYLGTGAYSGPGADVTNLEAIKDHIERSGMSGEFKLNMAKNLLGLQTHAQAASVMLLNGGKLGGLQAMLQRAGVDLKDVNATGIQKLAKLDPNASADMVRSIATANREETEWTKMQDSLKKLDDIKINTGDKLIGPINDMRGYLAAIAGELAPDSEYVKLKNGFGERGGSFRGKGSTGSWGDDTRGGGASGSWGAGGDLFDRVLQQESGGRHMVGGKLVRSPKGALGISQIMPATGADPGFGIAPLRDQSEAEYRRLGSEYLNAMLQRYGNDKAKALAAYNAGPAAVDAAIKAGGADWMSFMPAETQRYVPNVLAGEATPLPGNARAGATSGPTANVNVNVTGEIKAPGGQTFRPEVTTRVSEPRGAGTRGASGSY